MKKRVFISTLFLICIAALLIVLVRMHMLPASLYTPSETSALPTIQLPVTANIPKVVLPGTLKKIDTTAPATPPAILSSDWLLTRAGIEAQTNLQRTNNNVAILHDSAALDKSAQVKANDIIARQYFAHIDPSGKGVGDLVTDQGYTYIKVGENLALGNFKSDEDVVTAWMNSPGHRANILDSAFSDIGVGVAYGMYQGRMVYVAVQHFGTPRSLCPGIDTNLKSQVAAMEKYIFELAASLQSKKTAIDEGSGGSNTSSAIDTYNKLVLIYQKAYADMQSITQKYNAEVAAFNVCLNQITK